MQARLCAFFPAFIGISLRTIVLLGQGLDSRSDVTLPAGESVQVECYARLYIFNNFDELASLVDRGALIKLPIRDTTGAFVRCRWLCFVREELVICPTVRVCIATLVPTMGVRLQALWTGLSCGSRRFLT